MDENLEDANEETRLLRSVNEDPSDDVEQDKPRLARHLSLLGGVSLIVATIIGSGIYVSPNGVLAETGSVGAALFVWIGAGVVACMTALCFCELGCAIPSAGGLYAYLLHIYGELVAFLFVWTFDLVASPAGLAIINVTLADYLISTVTENSPAWAIKVTAAGFLILVLIVNCVSLRAMAKLQTFLMVVKVAGISLLLVAAVVYLGKGNTENIEEFFTNTTIDAESVTFAVYQGLWAYNGWDTLFHAGEELQNNAHVLPLAIKIGMAVVIIAYLAANTAYISLLSAPELIASDAIAKDATEVGLGRVAGQYIIPIIVVFACIGSCNGSIFMIGRQVFAAAREGHFPKFLSLVHRKRRTPIPALIVPCAIGLVIIMLPNKSVSSLIEIALFATWIFYFLIILGVLILRYREPELPRPYRVWLGIPILAGLVAIYLFVVPFLKQPLTSGVILAFILAGVPVYYFLIKKQCFIPERMESLSDALVMCTSNFCGVG